MDAIIEQLKGSRRYFDDACKDAHKQIVTLSESSRRCEEDIATYEQRIAQLDKAIATLEAANHG